MTDNNIPRTIKCSVHEISDIKQFPKDLSVEDILIRSSNIGTLMLAQKIGEKDYRKFIKEKTGKKPFTNINLVKI